MFQIFKKITSLRLKVSIECQRGEMKKNPHHIILEFKNKKDKEKILNINKKRKHITSKE